MHFWGGIRDSAFGVHVNDFNAAQLRSTGGHGPDQRLRGGCHSMNKDSLAAANNRDGFFWRACGTHILLFYEPIRKFIIGSLLDLSRSIIYQSLGRRL
jgi:hypothetical protein